MQGGVRKGLLAEAVEFALEVFVLAEPATKAAFANVGFARGGADGRTVSRASMARSCDGVRPSFRIFDEFIAVRLVDDNFFMMRNSPHVYATRTVGMILGA